MTRIPLCHDEGLSYSHMTNQWRYRFGDVHGTVLCSESLDWLRKQLDIRDEIGHEAWLKTLVVQQRTFASNGSEPPAA